MAGIRATAALARAALKKKQRGSGSSEVRRPRRGGKLVRAGSERAE